MSTASPATHAISRVLYRRYYENGDLHVAGMSSHWRAFAPKTTVRLDASGAPVDAIGVGFGDMNRRRRGNALCTAVAAAIHGVSHPARHRVPGAIAETWRASRRAGLVFNQDALRQALTFALLSAHLDREGMRRILMIGDGYGLLGAVLARWNPRAQVVFIDLGRSLLFQAMTCGRLFADASHVLVGEGSAADVERSRFVYCPADRLDQWTPAPVNLAVNIASMQEMAPDVVNAYFALLRQSPTEWFYCCNRERKVMPGGEVAEFMRFPWRGADEHVIDGPCPWHQWYVAPVRGAAGLPTSFRTPYDGRHLHRLTRLETLR